MKSYIWNNETYDHLPDPLEVDGGQITPVSEALFESLGGVIEDDGEPTHMELLDAACDVFVDVSFRIGAFIGAPDFQGGIDEIKKLRTFAATLTDPTQIIIALKLMAEWEGADKECNHWASKEDVGLASPAWWWYCWERYARQQEELQEQEEQE